jgi:hypothetical protein
MENGLTSRQNNFVKHIAAGNNATKSAVLAGYSKKSARFTASKLLTNSNILQQLEEIFDHAGLSDEALVTRLKTAIDSGIGQKANNSDALKGLKMAFELKGRLDQKVEIEATQESELRMQLSTMSEDELTDYLDTITQRTQDLVVRMKERRLEKRNGDNTKVSLTSPKVLDKKEPVAISEVATPIPEVRVSKAIGVRADRQPIKQPDYKMSISAESGEDNHFKQKVSYPA